MMKMMTRRRKKHHQWRCRNKPLRVKSHPGDRRRTSSKSKVKNSRLQMPISRRVDKSHRDRADRKVSNQAKRDPNRDRNPDRRAHTVARRTSRAEISARDKVVALFVHDLYSTSNQEDYWTAHSLTVSAHSSWTNGNDDCRHETRHFRMFLQVNTLKMSISELDDSSPRQQGCSCSCQPSYDISREMI